MYILRFSLSFLWLLGCEFFLFGVVCWPEVTHIPTVILYSLYLVIGYFGFDLLMKNVFIDGLNARNKYYIIMATLSLICTLCIVIVFICLIVQSFEVFLKFNNFMSRDNFIFSIKFATAFFSGAGIGLIMWHWVLAKNLNGAYYIVAKLEFISVLIVTYAFSLSCDYTIFIKPYLKSS